MDTRLARTVFTLLTAAKLKQSDPEASNTFVNRNPSYFINETDRIFTNIEIDRDIKIDKDTSKFKAKNNLQKDINEENKRKRIEERKKQKEDRMNTKFVDLNYEFNR